MESLRLHKSIKLWWCAWASNHELRESQLIGSVRGPAVVGIPLIPDGHLGLKAGWLLRSNFLLVILKSIFFLLYFDMPTFFRNFWKILSKFSSETKVLKILSFHVLKIQLCMYRSHFFYFYFITHFLSFCLKIWTLFYLSVTLQRMNLFFVLSNLVIFICYIYPPLNLLFTSFYLLLLFSLVSYIIYWLAA